MEDLTKLKQEVLDYCKRRQKEGGTVAEYACPHCQGTLVSGTPNNKKEVWDTLAKCYECGELYFAIKTKGKVEAKKISEDEAIQDVQPE